MDEYKEIIITSTQITTTMLLINKQLKIKKLKAPETIIISRFVMLFPKLIRRVKEL